MQAEQFIPDVAVATICQCIDLDHEVTNKKLIDLSSRLSGEECVLSHLDSMVNNIGDELHQLSARSNVTINVLNEKIREQQQHISDLEGEIARLTADNQLLRTQILKLYS